MNKSYLAGLLLVSLPAFSQTNPIKTKVSLAADKIESKVIEWRRDFHEHPELGNNETRTAAIVAKHLQSLGIEVKTGVAMTGVVGILKGGKPDLWFCCVLIWMVFLLQKEIRFLLLQR